MQRQISLWCLISCLFMMPSTATAEERLPDLVPVVVNVNQGYVEVRNIGNAVAEPSQLYVVCSTIIASGKNEPCAAGLHLSGYIEKWNTLPFDIPALQPGSSYPLHLFGSGFFPRQSSISYGMKLAADPLKHIAESNEINNYTRLDIKRKHVIRKIERGQLQVKVLMNGVPIKAAIILTAPGQTAHEMPLVQRRVRMKQTPFEASWPIGKYDLYIHSEVSSPVNVYMQSKAIPIEIKKGKRLEKSVTIPSGRLQLGTTIEGKKTTGMKVKISTLQGDFKYFYGMGLLKVPLDVSLPAGQYKLEAKSVEQKQSQFANVEIKASRTINKSLNFNKLRIGYLKLNVLMGGKTIPFEYGFNSPARDLLSDVSLSSSETGKPFVPLEAVRNKPIKLREGVYDLKVHERTVGGKDIVIKRITIREGETIEKTVAIRQAGELHITARWTHQPLNIIACAAYYNPVNFNRLGALMGGGSGSGGRSRGGCLDPNAYLQASISSPGRSDGDIAKRVHLKSISGKNSAGKIDDDVRIQAIDIEPGIYDIVVWPSIVWPRTRGDHRNLKQTLKGILITAGEITQKKKKLKFRWPGKKK